MSQLKALETLVKEIRKEQAKFLSEEPAIKNVRSKVTEYLSNLEKLLAFVKTKFLTFRSKLPNSVANANNIATSVAEIQNEAGLTAEEKESILAELRQGLKADYEEYKMSETVKEITRIYHEITAINFNVPAIEELLETITISINNLSKESADLDKSITTLTSEQNTIIQSQNIIREKNILTDLSDRLDLIDFKSLKPSEEDLIKTAIKMAKHNLNVIGEGIKYSQLADARIKIVEKIETLREEKQQLVKQKDGYDVTITDCNRTSLINNQKINSIKTLDDLIGPLSVIQVQFSEYNEAAIPSLTQLTKLWSY
jgi:chromosome segregation ATPase